MEIKFLFLVLCSHLLVASVKSNDYITILRKHEGRYAEIPDENGTMITVDLDEALAENNEPAFWSEPGNKH